MSGRTITDGNVKSKNRYCYRDAYVSKGTGIHRKKGWITSTHHLLYNIIRGKPIETGFTPYVWRRVEKCWGPNAHYFYYFDGFRNAAEDLILIIKYAVDGYNDINKGKLTNMTFFKLKKVREFLEPFCDSITLTDLCSIDTGTINQYLHQRFKAYDEMANEIAIKKHKAKLEKEDD